MPPGSALPLITMRRTALVLASATGVMALSALMRGGRTGLVEATVSPLSAALILMLSGALLSALFSGARPLLRWAAVSLAGLAFLAALVSLLALAKASGPPAGIGPLSGGLVQGISVPAAVALLGAALSILFRWGLARPSWPARQASALLALAPMGAGILGLMGFWSGMPLLYGAQRMPLSLPAGLGALALGLALLLTAGPDTWPLALFRMTHPEDEGFEARWFAQGPLGLFLLLGIGILGAGSLYLRGQIRSAQEGTQRELAAVADLKARQIEDWYQERRADGEQILHSGLIQTQVGRFLAGAPGAAPEAQIRGWMENLRGAGYQRLVLFDAQGRTRLSVPPDPAIPSPGDFSPGWFDAARIREALQSHAVLMQDLHRDPEGSPIHMSLWVPIRPRPTEGGPAEGLILLMVDPARYLFPLVQAWPGPSPSAETLLVRGEGDAVVFLNDLRHQTHPALALKLPLKTHPDLPAAQAVAGREGPFEGRDYRGEPVLATLRRVAGTPWFLVAKVDEAEVYGPARHRMWAVEGGLLGLLVLVALLAGLVVRHLDADQIKARLDLEREKRILSDRYAHLMDQASDIILVLDLEGRILEANAQAVAQYGHPLESLRAMTIRDLRAPETREDIPGQYDRVMTGASLRFETEHLRANGTTFPVEVSTRKVQVGGKAAILSFIRDITERRAQERELQRMTRLYAALSQVNQAIVWSPSRELLLDKICEVMVAFGKFSMAWIGWDDPVTRRVVVAARHGDIRGMLDRVVVRSDDSPEGHGAMGTAIREACPCVINDFLAGPESSPWREELLASGFASIAAFPIRQAGEVRGALAVYASEKDFFGVHEAALLEEAAMDISFALDHMAGEEQRREAEVALQDSERFLQAAQEAGGIGTYVWDIQGDRWKGSPYLDRIFGIDDGYPRDLEGWTSLIAPAFRERMREYVAGIIERRERFDLDYPIIRVADGAHRWLHGTGEIQWDGEGRPLALTGVIQDITDRKHAEEALRASEEKFSKAFHASPDSVNINRLSDGIYLAVNEGFTRITGYAEADVLGRSSLPGDLGLWVRTEDRDRLRAGLQREGRVVSMEASFRRKDGSVLTGLMSASLIEIDGEPCVLSITRDITELRAQARQLERLTRMYAALSQVNQAIVWSPDRDALLAKICEVMVEFGKFSMAWIGWNDPATHEVRVAARHGDALRYLDGLRVRSDDTPMGRGPTGIAIREARPCVVNDFLANSEAEPWHEDARRAGFAASAAFPIRLEGQVCGALMVYASERFFFGDHEVALLEEAAGDVSFALDHLSGEARRLEAESTLRKVSVAVEQSPLSVVITDPGGTIEYVNPRFTQATGYRFEEAIGQNPRILKSPATPPEVHRQMWETLGRGEVWVGEFENLKKGGEPFQERATIAPVKDASGTVTHYVALKEDITVQRRAEAERRTLEAQLHQSQKLESLGSLAGGVAHDMNNVLGAILSLASTLREKADPRSPEFRSLETIQTACLRGRGVVKSLLYFARKDLQEEACIDLNALVKEMTQLLSYTTLKRIRLEMDLQEPLGRLRGDAGALSHALMNLCVNALDAMPGSGILRIQTAAGPDGGLLVRVADTGQGMSPEVLERAVEPFFTTKPKGKGTGLGLPMVYGTMQAHEGGFELRSEPGKGTEAILRFPASRVEPAETCGEAATAPAAGAQISLRILLVDDDELIRESVASVLEILGHSVVTATGGQPALDLLADGQVVDLAILDMNMPGMNGAEALPRILALRPGLPVLMATGYSDEDIAPLIAGHRNVASIQKPFSMRELGSKLKDLRQQVMEGDKP
ncbi:MAG TPA: PAS domain S-box protein [Holophagaceae bacterium]